MKPFMILHYSLFQIYLVFRPIKCYLVLHPCSKFDYIMRCDGQQGKKLPDTICLLDPQPGEASMMKKRKNPCALRFHKVKEVNDPMRYMLSELMLYRPLREEVPQHDILALYEEKHGETRKIEIVKSQVMEHLESVTEARFYAEEAKKELDLEEVAETMDAQGLQDNDDCNDEGLQDHPEYMVHHPGNKLALCFLAWSLGSVLSSLEPRFCAV